MSELNKLIKSFAWSGFMVISACILCITFFISSFNVGTIGGLIGMIGGMFICTYCVVGFKKTKLEMVLNE